MANQRRVAVIGAGASGLTAIKCCLDEGLDVVCFERTDYISGLWHYTEQEVHGQGCVMKSTIINTTKEMMCYSDFPIPKEFAIFMHNKSVDKYFHLYADAFGLREKILFETEEMICYSDFPIPKEFAIFMHNKSVDEYFHLYADAFGLRKKILFETEVLSVTPADDFADTGIWNIVTRKGGNTTNHVFDAVLVCTGHHAEINMPTFPGMGDFQNQIIHSHDFKNALAFENKRVVVVGIGNSGGDIAVELSKIASQVYLSTRSGAWVFNRLVNGGDPLEMVFNRRYNVLIASLFPRYFVANEQSKLNKQCNHKKYNLEPTTPVLSQHPTVNDDLPNRIAAGTVKVKPNIAKFTSNGVQFTDGTKADDIDLIAMATGYVFGFPFLGKLVDVKDNEVKLYKYMFPPNLEKNTLAIIGCFQPVGAIMPGSEMQCRLATRVFKGEVTLPNAEKMNADIESKRVAMEMRYQKSLRHTIQVDYIDYMDQLSTLNGCKPNLVKLFFSDPKLALECYFGPCSPYQYRLTGPGAWAGAREAIMTQWDRTYYPLNKNFRQIEKDLQHQKTKQKIVKCLTVATIGVVVTIVLKTDAKEILYTCCSDMADRGWNLASQLGLGLKFKF